MIFTIRNLEKISLNRFYPMHWAKKEQFKNILKIQTKAATNCLSLKGGYNLKFKFYFVGKKIDTINVSHYCKTIEDAIFMQDKDNRTITIDVLKSDCKENYVELTIER